MALDAAALALRRSEAAAGVPVATLLAAAALSWNGVLLTGVAAAAPADEVAGATADSMVCVFAGGFMGPVAFALVAALTRGNLDAGCGLLAAAAAAAVLVAGPLGRQTGTGEAELARAPQ